MVQHVIQFVPDSAPTWVVLGLWVLAAAGVLLWAAGSMMSRYVVALLTVLLGASVGMRLPDWCGWSISGAGPAVAAALILGVSGFALHGAWMGVLLGLVLAMWSALGVWVLRSGGQPMNWPEIHEFTTIASFCQEWWIELPPEVKSLLPFTTGAAMVSALAAAILWTRLTTAIAWSTVGATSIFVGAIAAVDLSHPQWLVREFPPTPVQVVAFVVMILIGAAIQWKLTAGAARKAQARSKPHTQRDHIDEMERAAAH